MFGNFSYDTIADFLEKKLLENNRANESKLRKMFLQYGYYRHYPELEIKNKVIYEGEHILNSLPEKNVMFVSSHSTYFMDSAILMRKLMTKDGYTIANPKTNISTIIARETFESLPMPRLLKYSGLIPIRRQWKEGKENRDRGIDVVAIKKTLKALKEGWLVNFPTGTTDPDAIVRPGTATYIKKTKPIVVPVYLEGVRECFGQKGTKSIKNVESEIRVVFKEPLEIDCDDIPEVITAQISCAIRNP